MVLKLITSETNNVIGNYNSYRQQCC